MKINKENQDMPPELKKSFEHSSSSPFLNYMRKNEKALSQNQAFKVFFSYSQSFFFLDEFMDKNIFAKDDADVFVATHSIILIQFEDIIYMKHRM